MHADRSVWFLGRGVGPGSLWYAYPAADERSADLPADRESSSRATPPDHTKRERTVRYLGIEVHDALVLAESTEI